LKKLKIKKLKLEKIENWKKLQIKINKGETIWKCGEIKIKTKLKTITHLTMGMGVWHMARILV
jgi:hypothetical protein